MPLALSVVAVVAVGAVALIALGHGQSIVKGAVTSPPLRGPVAHAPGVAPVLLRHYAILRRPTGRGFQPLPREGLLVKWEVGHLGLDLAMVRMAEPAPGVRVWLVPGSAGSCVLVRVAPGSGGGGCGPGTPDEAEIGGTSSSSRSQMVAGFVPDGNRTVTATLADGGTISAPVIDNAFVLRTPNSNGFVSLLIRTVSGSRRAIPIGLPSSPPAVLRQLTTTRR